MRGGGAGTACSDNLWHPEMYRHEWGTAGQGGIYDKDGIRGWPGSGQ